MMSKIFAIATIIGAVAATKAHPTPTPSPVVEATPAPVVEATPIPADLSVFLGNGTGVQSSGNVAVGVAADKDSGAAAGKLDNDGDVIVAAGPEFASGFAQSSPTL